MYYSNNNFIFMYNISYIFIKNKYKVILYDFIKNNSANTYFK